MTHKFDFRFRELTFGQIQSHSDLLHNFKKLANMAQMF